jgi:hypothetical protein
MIKIGYLSSPSLGLEHLLECQPTPIKLLGGNLTKCPAVRGYHQNTFEVKCPFDLEWTVSKHPMTGCRAEINPDNCSLDMEKISNLENILAFDREGKVVQVLINPGWSFVSDTPNTIMLQHSNGIDTNPQIVTGQMDIYKWADRKLSVGYSLENGGDEQTFTLKRGQPWYRVTFFVPDLKPITLVKMEERPEFLKRTRNKTDLTIFKNLNWRKIFTDFGNSRPKKLIP